MKRSARSAPAERGGGNGAVQPSRPLENGKVANPNLLLSVAAAMQDNKLAAAMSVSAWQALALLPSQDQALWCHPFKLMVSTLRSCLCLCLEQ